MAKENEEYAHSHAKTTVKAERKKEAASQPRAQSLAHSLDRQRVFLSFTFEHLFILLLMPLLFHCVQPVPNRCQPAPNRCCKLRRRQSLFLLIWFSELTPIEPMFFTGVSELEPISKSQADCQLIAASER